MRADGAPEPTDALTFGQRTVLNQLHVIDILLYRQVLRPVFLLCIVIYGTRSKSSKEDWLSLVGLRIPLAKDSLLGRGAGVAASDVWGGLGRSPAPPLPATPIYWGSQVDGAARRPGREKRVAQ